MNDIPIVTPRQDGETVDDTSVEGMNLEPETEITLKPCNKDLIRSYVFAIRAY